jgi:sec-independent protein translocase protein TatA
MLPFGIHPVFLLVLLAIVLIIFGPGKLPELGGAVGRGIREFRKASSELTDEVKRDFAAERVGKQDVGPVVSPATPPAPEAEKSPTDKSV